MKKKQMKLQTGNGLLLENVQYFSYRYLFSNCFKLNSVQNSYENLYLITVC